MAFRQLAEHHEQLDGFVVSLQNKTEEDVNKMVATKEMLREGLDMVKQISSRLQPGPYHNDLLHEHARYEIEDTRTYRTYLETGMVFASHLIFENNRLARAKREAHTVDWDKVLGEFKDELVVHIERLVHLHKLCVEKRL